MFVCLTSWRNLHLQIPLPHNSSPYCANFLKIITFFLFLFPIIFRIFIATYLLGP